MHRSKFRTRRIVSRVFLVLTFSLGTAALVGATPASASNSDVTKIKNSIAKTTREETARILTRLTLRGSGEENDGTETFRGTAEIKTGEGRYADTFYGDTTNVRIKEGDVCERVYDAPSGKKWACGNVSEYFDTLSYDPAYGFTETFQIASTLSILRGVTKAENKGSQTLGSIKTTKYLATIDLQKALNTEQEFEPEFEDQILEAWGDTTKALVWLDKAGRLRQLEFQAKVRDNDFFASYYEVENIKGVARLVYSLGDFGTKVVVKMPPEEQTMTFEEYDQSFDGESPGGAA